MITYLLPLRQNAALFLTMLIAATVLAVLHFGPSPRAVAACVLLYTLVALTLIDARTHLLPDVLTLPLIGLGVAFSAFGVTGTVLLDSVIGAVIGYGALWGVNTLFRHARQGRNGLRRLQAACWSRSVVGLADVAGGHGHRQQGSAPRLAAH